MIRTFIAIKISTEISFQNRINTLKQSLRNEKIRWVDINSLHVTLRFLGDIPSTKTELISDCLEDAINEHKAFELVLEGVGVFRSIYRPRVIWLGLKETKKLAALKSSVDKLLERAGFDPEENNFSPHLTIGRMKYIENRDNLEDILKENNHRFFSTQFVEQVLFYQSLLHPSGSEYKVLSSHKLIHHDL